MRMRVVLPVLFALSIMLATSTTAKADEGVQIWWYPINWQFDAHIYSPHYGFGGPGVGCCKRHINWVIHYHPHGWWSGYQMRTQVNLHASFQNNRCVYVWDSVSGRDRSFCRPNIDFDAQVNALASACDEFARNELHIFLPIVVYIALAYFLLVCLA